MFVLVCKHAMANAKFLGVNKLHQSCESCLSYLEKIVSYSGESKERWEQEML